MISMLNLKEIERKAFRTTFQDGLYDMQIGLIVAAMSIFMYHPASGFTPLNPIGAVLLITMVNLLYQLVKRKVSLPRMGAVRFGAIRKQKTATLGLILAVLVLVQAGLVVLTATGWLSSAGILRLNELLTNTGSMDAAVAAIGALAIGVSFTFIAFFSDFPRGYYLALMSSLAAFLMLYLNQPIYPILIGALVFIPGLVLFLRFLKEYPRPTEAGDA